MNSIKNFIKNIIFNTISNNLFHLSAVFIRTVLSGITRFLPIQKNIIVFSSYPDFSDNSWAVYKYLKDNRSDLKLYWIMHSDSKPDEISEKEVLKIDKKHYLNYYWIICRAGFIMSTHGCKGDMFNRKRKTNIYLNHGGCSIKGEKPERRTLTSCKKTYDYALCRGKAAIPIVSYVMCCEPKRILPLGMARDDFFCKNIGSGKENPFYNGFSSKLILWMPTFRKSVQPDLSENYSATPTGLPLMNNEEQVIALDKFLQSKDIQLLIKIHPLQEDNSIFEKHFSNINFITNNDLNSINKQTYEVIGYSDALITDYSSVYFDYLITDKPIGFILDDYDKYEQDRGFAMDNPKEIMAGHQIYAINQLEAFFSDIAENIDRYKEKRQIIKSRFVGENPESTSERIVRYFNI